MATGFVLRSIVFHLRLEYFLMFPFNWLQCLFLSSFERINGKVALLSLRMCRMSPCGKFQGEKYQKEKKKNIWEPQPTVKWNGKAFHMKKPPIARSRDYFENNNRSKYFELCVGKVTIVLNSRSDLFGKRNYSFCGIQYLFFEILFQYLNLKKKKCYRLKKTQFTSKLTTNLFHGGWKG